MNLVFVSEIFRNMLVFEIFNEDFIVNQHSKSISIPKFELQLHLALQQKNITAGAFYTKKIAMPNIFHMAPFNPVQLLWGLSYESYQKGYFWRILGT